MRAQSFRRVQLFETPWTVARQAPLSMRFSRQEYWSGLPFPSPGNLPDRRIELSSLTASALAGGFFTTKLSGKPMKVKVKSLSRVRLFVTPWTVAHQALLSMRFLQQEYKSGLPFPPPGDLPNPRTEHRSSALQVDSSPSEPPGKPWG